MQKKYSEIDTDDQLKLFCKSLVDKNTGSLAIDFECEFNLHIYGEKLCLIQVFDGNEYYLIDPFSISDSEIKIFLGLKKITKIFYSADSDRSLVFRQYGLKMGLIYDIQHLVEVLGIERKGLDSVLFSELGIEVAKKKKFQRYNWTRRPIDEEAKQYALNDVAYLFELSASLIERIYSENKIEDLIYRLVGVDNTYDKKSFPSIFKTPAYQKMSNEDQALYSRIVKIRENHAKELNVPPNTVFNKQNIVDITYNIYKVEHVRFNHAISQNRRKRIISEILALK